MFKTFNVNSDVKVRLTDKGREFFYSNKYYTGTRYQRKLVEDEQGYSTWQLWVLMEEFGPHISMFTNCFETNILLNDEDLDLVPITKKA
jgi:hypothetical protein